MDPVIWKYLETRRHVCEVFSHNISCLMLLHGSSLFYCRPRSYHDTVRFGLPIVVRLLWYVYLWPLLHVWLCIHTLPYRQRVDTAQIGPPRVWTTQGSRGSCASLVRIVTPEEAHETASLARDSHISRATSGHPLKLFPFSPSVRLHTMLEAFKIKEFDLNPIFESWANPPMFYGERKKDKSVDDWLDQIKSGCVERKVPEECWHKVAQHYMGPKAKARLSELKNVMAQINGGKYRWSWKKFRIAMKNMGCTQRSSREPRDRSN